MRKILDTTPKALAAAVDRLVFDKQPRLTLGEHNRSWAQENVPADMQARKWLERMAQLSAALRAWFSI